MADSGITIRLATDEDLDDIIAVGARALGWRAGEPNRELFEWKHRTNSFGPSPIWLAESDGRLAGYRAFMRWELVDRDGRTWRAVRAVDTATDPDFQRRGIFSKLTRHGLDEVDAEGVDIVFNTPNEQSRPGYLKMGWVDIGRLPVAVRPTSLLALPKLTRARTAAAKWSESSKVGVNTAALDDEAIDELLETQRSSDGLATPLSREYLSWRYGLDPLRYRVWAPDGVGSGFVVFRVRMRGAARECVVATVLAPSAESRRERALLSSLAKAVDADYLLRIGPPDLRAAFLPLPNQGPRLTTREVTSAPPAELAAWDFQLGDIELF